MLPHVIIHNAMSLDGCITNFTVDLGLYYKLAAGFGEDATLAGSNTILAGSDEIPEETEEDLEKPEVAEDDKRPILVIPDSAGRVRIWHALKSWPFWCGFVALITEKTPQDYIDYLEERHIDHITVGDVKVDLKAALEMLNKKYNVKTLRVDSGGTLNGLLLQAGLVDEVSVLVHPVLVGSGGSRKSIFQVIESDGLEGGIELKLTHQQEMKNGIIWLKYKVKM